MATASDDARLGYSDSIPGEDKRLKESRRRMVDGSQSKRTQSSVIGRCAGGQRVDLMCLTANNLVIVYVFIILYLCCSYTNTPTCTCRHSGTNALYNPACINITIRNTCRVSCEQIQLNNHRSGTSHELYVWSSQRCQIFHIVHKSFKVLEKNATVSFHSDSRYDRHHRGKKKLLNGAIFECKSLF